MPLTCFPDTTVLINFALIGRLDVLDALLHNRFWSATVSDECAKQYTKHGVAASYAQAQTIFGTPVYPTADESRRMLTIRNLMCIPTDGPTAHMGEAETIAIATTHLRQGRVVFVTDDVSATAQAEAHNIKVLSTLDLLRVAYRRGLISTTQAWTYAHTLRTERNTWPAGVSHKDLDGFNAWLAK